jgi:hypothetical protein
MKITRQKKGVLEVRPKLGNQVSRNAEGHNSYSEAENFDWTD